MQSDLNTQDTSPPSCWSDAIRFASREVAKLAAHFIGNRRVGDVAMYEQGIGCERASKMLLEEANLIERNGIDFSSIPLFKSGLTQEEKEIKRTIMRDQIQHLVTAPREQQIFITCCACNHRAVVWMMYRCLYCGCFYCKECGQIHFGQRKPEIAEDRLNKG